jgi:hypothetical protein
VESRSFKVIAVVALIAAVVVVLSPMVSRDADVRPAPAGQGPLVISLAPPAFAQTAGLKFPMNEVGISAYVNMGVTIDLAKARGLFSAVEDATDTYVIGTVVLTGNAEDMWPHVYVSKDGWLLAYYPKTEPTSKLFQWYGYQRDVIGTTTLRDTLITLGRALSLDLSKIDTGMHYFHFQYPDATKLLFAVDTVGQDNDAFRYTIPSDVTLYDVSFSHYGVGVGGTSISSIDGTNVLVGGAGTYVYCRQAEGQYLTPNAAHTANIYSSSGWAGLAIVFLYR